MISPWTWGSSPQFSDKLIWQLPHACDQSPIPFCWKYKVCSWRILQFLQAKSHVARPTNLCCQIPSMMISTCVCSQHTLLWYSALLIFSHLGIGQVIV